VLSGEKKFAGLGLLVSFGSGLTFGALRPGSAALTGAALTGAVALAGASTAWAGLLTRHRRRTEQTMADLAGALARETVLGDLGAKLLAAGDPDRMLRVTAGAASGVLRECPGSWAAVLSIGPDDDFAVLIAGSPDDRLPLEAMPTDLLVRLAGGEFVSADAPSALGLTGFGPERPISLLPLVRGEHFFGVLATGTDDPVPAAVAAALQAVRTQASLALEGEALSAELNLRATRDSLTGLGNRQLLCDRLAAALARARRSNRPVGVLLLDLQRFRHVNEVHGHEAGDELLRVVADRLRAGVRTEDTIGRLGGDQFAVIAEDLRTAQDIVIIAERLVDSLGRSVPVGGRIVKAPASMGIALSHPDTDGPDQLLREAESAMTIAKRQGGGRYQLHGATA
jgi:diguanylate cyclase (GGDEF)-like protein